MEKFLGVGLKNALGLWLLFMLLSVMAKTVLTKHEVEGVSDFVRAS